MTFNKDLGEIIWDTSEEFKIWKGLYQSYLKKQVKNCISFEAFVLASS
jgi:hypothetical protein